jgi:hypothetical protein
MERVDERSLPIWQRQQIFSRESGANLKTHFARSHGSRDRFTLSLETSITLKGAHGHLGAQCHDDAKVKMRSANTLTMEVLNFPGRHWSTHIN